MQRLLWIAAICSLLSPPLMAAEKELTFEQHVRPLLRKYCFQCHGDEDEHEAQLDLRLVRLMLAGGESGPALVAGKANDSLLLQRLEKGEMPPEGKKLLPAEIATIRRWIDAGAKTAGPEPAELARITDEERAFWSFQPIRNPQLPVVANGQQAQSPVDSFLLKELAAKGLSFSSPAEKRTLVRRLWFTLLGLPPTAEEIEAFVADESPDAYERLIDRLLASPHYGERWARHWLDVAGYADSDGFSEKDFERPNAYKYRDYVIRSFNDDKPWNQFIVEQLAGDELLKPPYANLSPAQADQLIATGFLRMGPDGTGDTTVDQTVARNEVVADTLKIVSTSLLGLSVGCAQCHNHRYDPVPQTDYYQLRAIFEPAYDVKNWRPPGARNVSLWSAETRTKAKEIQAALAANAKEKAAELEKLREAAQEKQFSKLLEDEQEFARTAVDTPAKERTKEQKDFLTKRPSLVVITARLDQFDKKGFEALNKKYAEQIARLNKQKPAENEAAALTEVPGKVPTTYVFHRGDVNSPRAAVQPAELTVLIRDQTAELSKVPVDDPALPTTGRRLAYAKWLTSGEHPLVARVLVNRFWLHHFGRGIVATPSDFGALGARPTHPELLDWLATRFLQDGWELKRFHRLLLTSAAFQQSSARTDEIDAVDPDNQLLGRMNLRRLESETLRDALLQVTGRLTIKLHGKSVPVMPDEVGQVVVGVDTRDGAGRPTGKVVPLGAEEFRRSIYVQVRRSLPLSMFETFDAPLLTPNCEIRNQSTAAPQSLLLMNNRLVLDQATFLAGKIAEHAGAEPADRINAAWRAIFSSDPTPSQRAAAEEFLAAQTKEFESVKPPPMKTAVPAEIRALASLCQALLGSNEFLYVD
jgi:hypothetical protein